VIKRFAPYRGEKKKSSCESRGGGKEKISKSGGLETKRKLGRKKKGELFLIREERRKELEEKVPDFMGDTFLGDYSEQILKGGIYEEGLRLWCLSFNLECRLRRGKYLRGKERLQLRRGEKKRRIRFAGKGPWEQLGARAFAKGLTPERHT